MRIVFFGTSEFAVPILETLFKSSHSLLEIVTQPDRPQGRSLKLTESPIKQFAVSHQLEVVQPEQIKTPEFLDSLKKLRPDLFVVVSYGKILSESLLKIPKLFSLNIHASLLPKYRGASPIATALLNEESETGITIMKMNQKLDSGDIMLQKSIPIEKNEIRSTLSKKLADLGAQLTLEALELIEQEKATFTPQDESKVTMAPRLKKEDGKINWENSAHHIEAMIRALQPWPSAYTFCNKVRFKIVEGAVEERLATGRYGQILEINQKGISVSTGENVLWIRKVQPESRKVIEAADFARGYHVRSGDLIE